MKQKMINIQPFTDRINNRNSKGRKGLQTSFTSFNRFLKKSKQKPVNNSLFSKTSSQNHYPQIEKLNFSNQSSQIGFLPPKSSGPRRKYNISTTNRGYTTFSQQFFSSFSQTPTQKINVKQELLYSQTEGFNGNNEQGLEIDSRQLKSKIENNAMERFKQIFKKETSLRSKKIQDEQSRRVLCLLESAGKNKKFGLQKDIKQSRNSYFKYSKKDFSKESENVKQILQPNQKYSKMQQYMQRKSNQIASNTIQASLSSHKKKQQSEIAQQYRTIESEIQKNVDKNQKGQSSEASMNKNKAIQISKHMISKNQKLKIQQQSKKSLIIQKSAQNKKSQPAQLLKELIKQQQKLKKEAQKKQLNQSNERYKQSQEKNIQKQKIERETTQKSKKQEENTLNIKKDLFVPLLPKQLTNAQQKIKNNKTQKYQQNKIKSPKVSKQAEKGRIESKNNESIQDFQNSLDKIQSEKQVITTPVMTKKNSFQPSFDFKQLAELPAAQVIEKASKKVVQAQFKEVQQKKLVSNSLVPDKINNSINKSPITIKGSKQFKASQQRKSSEVNRYSQEQQIQEVVIHKKSIHPSYQNEKKQFDNLTMNQKNKAKNESLKNLSTQSITSLAKNIEQNNLKQKNIQNLNKKIQQTVNCVKQSKNNNQNGSKNTNVALNKQNKPEKNISAQQSRQHFEQSQQENDAIQELFYLISLVQNLGSYNNNSKQFYSNADSSMVQMVMNYRLAAFYIAHQFYFYENIFLQFLLKQKKGKFYTLQADQVEEAIQDQQVIENIGELKESYEMTPKLIKHTYEKCKIYLKKEEKQLKIQPKQDYHDKCVKYTKEQFKQIHILYEKNKTIFLAERLCFLIETYCIIMYLSGKQLKQFQELEDIGQENYKKHVQTYKKILLN